MLEIKDSVAVITGGASGIGLALSKYWVENGGKVVIGDVVEPALKQAAEELTPQDQVAAAVEVAHGAARKAAPTSHLFQIDQAQIDHVLDFLHQGEQA